MRLYKTGHSIADTVSDLIGDLPDGDYRICYGILRHRSFEWDGHWFEVDKGFWGADHYSGMYRLSYRGTQPRYSSKGPHKAHGIVLAPWRNSGSHALICPPTSHVCEFFNVDQTSWLMNALRQAGSPYIIRHKGDSAIIDWDSISKVITFNSTIAIEALKRGIPVISDPIHSTVGSFTSQIKAVDNYNREELLSFISGHQFRLNDTQSLCSLIKYYLSSNEAGSLYRLGCEGSGNR